MNKKPKVTVIGSINMDLTVSTSIVPEQGETVLGNEFRTYPGGKGANQAVAAARSGADVRMIGAVGSDAFGRELLLRLQTEGIDTTGIASIDHISTGTATIILCDHDNRIIVAPGANRQVTPEYVESRREMIEESDILLVQLEIPVETVRRIASIAKDKTIPLIVNPAPYQSLTEDILDCATYLTPNETEFTRLEKEYPWLGRKLIVTKGSEGVSINTGEKNTLIPGFIVPVKDTTGAGDTFNGALATKLAENHPLQEAVSFANAAAALSTTKLGAQSGMPTSGEVETFLKERWRSSEKTRCSE